MQKPPVQGIVVRRGSAELEPFLAPETARRVHTALRHALSDNTWRAYEADWKVFSAWCAENGVQSLPAHPDSIAGFLSDDAMTHKMSTVERRLTAISYFHKVAGANSESSEKDMWSPTTSRRVGLVVDGLQRQFGTRPTRKKAADDEVMRAVLNTIDGTTLAGLRDRALLLLGFAGAFRRSALCALHVDDLTFTKVGVDVVIRRGKEDPKGKGRVLGIVSTGGALCPVAALKTWLGAAKITAGPIFRGMTRWGTIRQKALDSATVARVLKTAISKAGLSAEDFGAHSLRAGHITVAVRRGAQLWEVMRTSGHRSVEMVNRYIREADTVRGSSATKVNLDEK